MAIRVRRMECSVIKEEEERNKSPDRKAKKEMINVKERYKRDPEMAKERAERFGFVNSQEIIIRNGKSINLKS